MKLHGEILANKSAVDRSKTDFYRTPPEVTIALMQHLKIPAGSTIWEPACGEGHIAEVLKELGYNVIATDLYDRGYGISGINFIGSEIYDFAFRCDYIITNPPFSEPKGIATRFIRQCISFHKPFALMFKSQFWHAEERK
jgi:type I restriction-modification system DNA methylase subunit